MLKILILLSFFLLLGCPKTITIPRAHTNQSWKFEVEHSNRKKLLIVSTNNIENQIYPQAIIDRTIERPLKLNIGGFEILAGYLNIIKKRYQKNFILLDSGHLFNDKNNIKSNASTIKAMNHLPYDAVLLSSREVINLKKLNIESKKIPFVNSNIYDIKENKIIEKYNSKPYRVIERSGLRIAVLGVTQFQNIKDKNKIEGIFFEDPVLSFLKIKEQLEKEKIDITILLANTTSNCHSPSIDSMKLGSDRKALQIKCETSEFDLVNLVKRLPPKSIDLIVNSDKKFLEGYIGEVPVLQNPGSGRYISMYELYWDEGKKRIDVDSSLIKRPTALCHDFLQLTEDCTSLEVLKKFKQTKIKDKIHFETKEAIFLDQTVSRDYRIKALLN